ncbi:putative Zn finger-like uncharacterized protein [Methylohalomonas lacus]|uniref:Zn finger-like uncharacterized protein n=1 Tax=Methylohalomonas lacus TaxID=398773 RepID=A0AAE3HMS2_9GAMM|nr:DUF3426 domain-containing protein [Methylohalomonas lacus]MCS3903989.1 putative Zn finger-like uncharacterized protein [Methylohalomonas lacus]
MYTRCPTCQTQFRVRATQLSAAAGRVRCGACGEAFDAVSRLTDTPQPAPLRSEEAAGVTAQAAGEPLRGDAARAQDSDPGRPAADFDNQTPLREVQPDWLEEEVTHRPRHRGRWLVIAVLLVAVALAQAAWFYRDMLYERFPQLLPWAQELCARIDCQVYRQRLLSEFELLNRDVRVHPVYQDALLVNATIAHHAGRRQPYPRLQLALFDTEGQPLAYREFAPEDYLDSSLPVSTGMPSNTPVHLVLELSGPAAGAVSFEFGFL